MTRPLKPLKLETLYLKQTSIDLFLDRDDKVFFGVVAGQRISAPDLNACKVKVKKALEELTTPEWKRVILVEFETSDRWNNNAACLNLKFDRFEIAKRQIFGNDKGRYSHWKRPWLDDFEADTRLLFTESDSRWESYDAKDEKLTPYQEEVWLGLQEVDRVIREAGKRIEKLVGTTAGLKELEAAGAKIGGLFLPSPGPKAPAQPRSSKDREVP